MGKWGYAIALIVLSIVVIGLLLSLPTWLLWNWVMPDIFGLPTITFGQAIGISVLAGLLFGHKGISIKSD